MYDELFNKLRELKPAGADGFEGLIKALLEDFAPDLGISFLAKSGFQGGIDVSSAGRGATWAGLECKHYEKGSCPSARELVGGLAIAISNSREQLDLWLLATTGAVGAHEAKELHQASEQAGVTVEIVDWQEAGPPTLAVLCAASPIHSFAELSKRLAHIDRPKLDADFSAIAAHPGFSATKAQMRERLSASRVGMSRARKNANAWIEQSLQSKENSYARFKQYLCPHDRAFGVFAERAVVTSGLNTWYGGWQAKPTLGVVHGPEGIGKSWAAMGWWSQLADQPLTLIVTSNMTLPTCGPVEWLAKLLSERTGFSNDTFWQKALERWLRRPAGLQPLILLVFDGLNEQPREEWISRLVGFREQAVAPHVAVLVTCWTTFWNQQLEARVPDILGRTLIQVKPFTDAELTAVLAPEGLAIDKLRPEVREFLRIPRVCRAAMGHLTGLADSNDLTVARLLVTDWKYRLKHKQGLTHTDRQFNDTVIGLAREILAGVTDFSKARLRSLSSLAQASPDRNLDRDFEEIVAGRLFEQVGDSETYRVRPEQVGLALGMLLAKEVQDAVNRGLLADYAIAQALDSCAGFSQVSDVLHGAVASACLWSHYPQAGIEALLLAWLRQRNRADRHHDDFAAYLADQPEAYLNISETVWSDFSTYPDGRSSVSAALLHYTERPEIFQRIAERVNSWLALWHRDWHPFIGRAEQERLDKQRAAITQRLENAIAAERQYFADHLREASSPDLVHLADLAFLVISYVGRSRFAKGFAAWAVSRKLMGLPSEIEAASWCLRLNRIDMSETERLLHVEAAALYACGGALTTNAAHMMLRALGTSGAASGLPVTRPSEWRTSPLRQASINALNPDAVMPSLDGHLVTLDRINPAMITSQMGVTSEDHIFDEIEPTLAAYAPDNMAVFVRNVIRTAPAREFRALRQLSIFAVENSQIFGAEERSALESARQALLDGSIGQGSKDVEFAESELSMCLLPHLTAEEQYDLVIERPSGAMLRNDMALLFKTMAEVECNTRLVALQATDTTRIQYGLWFLSSQQFALTPDARAVLVAFMAHSERYVRALTFEIAMNCNDDEALRHHAESDWRFNDGEKASYENFQGSLALGYRKGAVRYVDLRNRVTPELLGWLAVQDGSDEAYRQFADDLDVLWSILITREVADKSRNESLAVLAERPSAPVPTFDFITSSEDVRTSSAVSLDVETAEPDQINQVLANMNDPEHFQRQQAQSIERNAELMRRAQARGVAMFAHQFRPDGLAEIVRRNPHLVDKWVKAVEGDEARSILWRAGDFYRALVEVLASSDPKKAAGIVLKLRGKNSAAWLTVYQPLRIDSLLYATFTVTAEPYATELRDEWLNEAKTDEALFQFVLTALETGNVSWLVQIIERDAASGVLAVQARALTMLGLMDEGPELTRLRPLLTGRTAYLSEVADTAETRLERNRRARHWFAEFLRRPAVVQSWAAFRLMMRCIDRRFHLWSNTIIESTPEASRMHDDVLVLTKNDISNNIPKNEKTRGNNKLEEVLFGTKILQGKLHPWLN